MLVALVVLGRIRPIQYQFLLTETEVVQTIFNTILGGVILLVSIVVAVAAVGVGQELTTLGEQSDRVDQAIAYREQIDLPADVDMIPPQTGEFLAVVLRTIRERTDELDTIEEGRYDDEFYASVEHLTDNIHTNADELTDTLDRVQRGATDELLVGLDYDASWQLHATTAIIHKYGDELADEDRETLEELAGALRYFLVGREYFKSLYYKREFSDLSRALLWVSLPVIIFITYVMLALDVGLFPDVQILGVTPLALFISAAFTVSLAPYLVLTSYVFRAASITTRTMAAGPFVHGKLSER